MRRTLLLSFTLTFGLAGSAFARPDHEVPQMRQEIRQRVEMDGRADLHMDRARPSSMREVSEKTETGLHALSQPRVALPLKRDVTMKVNPEGRPTDDGAAKKSAQATTTKTVQEKRNPLEADHAPPLPLKTDVAMKLRGEATPEGSTAQKTPQQKSQAWSQNQSPSQKADESHKPASRQDKESLCRHTGVCLPQPAGSDDVEDKTE